MTGAKWFVLQEGKKKGPVGVAQLRSLVEDGELTEKTLIWRNGLDKWVPAGKVRGLFSHQKSSASALSQADSNSSASRNGTQATPAVPPKAESPIESAAGNQQQTPVQIALAVGTILIALALGGLVILGIGYLYRSDKQALQAEKQQLDQKRQKDEFQEWLNKPFDSEVAKRLRANVPSLASLLLRKMRDYRLERVPNSWESQSTSIKRNMFSGTLGYGSPYMVKDESALGFILRGLRPGFSYWQLDLDDGSVRKLSEYSDRESDSYNHFVVQNRGRHQICQFLRYSVIENKRPPKYQGFAHYVHLNLANGQIETFDEESKSSGNRDFVKAQILKRKLTASTRQPVSGSAAIRLANADLASRGMHFDLQTASLSLDPGTLSRWRSALRDIEIAKPDASSRLLHVSRQVDEGPDCPLTRDLRSTIILASSAAHENQSSLRGFLQNHSRHYLRNHAAMELLHLVARESDAFADYLKFQQQDPGTAARDLAVLRLHEIAYAHVMKEATTDSFDRFLNAFPRSLQWEDAFRHAYQLELERARFFVEHNGAPKARREEIARGFYVQWRDSLRDGNLPRAERFWSILKDEEDFNKTEAAVEAQNSKDRDIYQRKVIALMEERNQALSRIEQVQRERLAVAREQLSVIYEANAKLERISEDTGEIEEMMRNSLK